MAQYKSLEDRLIEQVLSLLEERKFLTIMRAYYIVLLEEQADIINSLRKSHSTQERVMQRLMHSNAQLRERANSLADEIVRLKHAKNGANEHAL